MTLPDSLRPERSARDNARALGDRYLLPHPAEYVIVPSGTVHLRHPGSRRTLCGTLIPLDGPRMSRYSTDPHTLTCNRCGQVVEKAGERWAAKKRVR
ncbi:hypothetical protein DAETH_28610 [Deinococcus aetherius]|uniref:Uncharacterized protein n=1 Tax=Deinococcus aetherius TaxID=200252 RepID=A0ABN6RMN5_9DEIO|nr:hypothetical protein [Deinococcus aetherius]BDP42892.1 hypothetical protein DAETH_28610 [Deinococcus aetherius]